MLLTAFLTVAALTQAPQAPLDPPRPAALASRATSAPDSVFPPAGDVIRLYTDCDESRWPYGIEERFVPKTREEVESGVARRRALEAAWRAWFAARAGDTIRPTPQSAWRYPLAQRGRLLNNYLNPRADGPHEALDIFVAREGVVIRAPVSGVVVAAGDGWRGSWDRRRRDVAYEGGGMARRTGNGAILFDPESGGYFLFSHLQTGLRVAAGDVVRAGAPIGRVGHTGNASQPGHGRHLHLAYKQPGTACGAEGVLVAVNPYRAIRSARDRAFRTSAVRRPPSAVRP